MLAWADAWSAEGRSRTRCLSSVRAVKFSYKCDDVWVLDNTPFLPLVLLSLHLFLILRHRIPFDTFFHSYYPHLHIPCVTHTWGGYLSQAVSLTILLSLLEPPTQHLLVFFSVTFFPPPAILLWSSNHKGLENVLVGKDNQRVFRNRLELPEDMGFLGPKEMVE